MNVKNNKMRRASKKKIAEAFNELIQSMELHKISVSDICKSANLNRSTFYDNYLDAYDLALSVKMSILDDFKKVYHDLSSESGYDKAVKIFEYIRDNQVVFQIYFKIDIDLDFYSEDDYEKNEANRLEMYNMEYFIAGFGKIVKKWLSNGCKESPEEMADFALARYKGICA